MDQIEGLHTALDSAIRSGCDAGPLAVMFSGGVDSSVIAFLASRHTNVVLYTVGLVGAHDLMIAERTALDLDLPWVPIIIDGKDIELAIPRLGRIMNETDPLVISFELPTYFVAEKCPEKMMMSGQGADELFGGYSRYLSLGTEERRAMMRNDLERLLQHGSPREKGIATEFGKGLFHPFLDSGVIEFAEHLPDDLLVHAGIRKIALRRLAERFDLNETAYRPKKAAQYGSGIMREMKRMARAKGLELGHWVTSLVESGTHEQ